MMDPLESLKRFGLNDTEAKIYLALIKAKESTAVQLAKQTEVHRRTIYDNLNILLRKGLVSIKSKNGVTYFNASNPDSLKIFLEEKHKVLEDVLPMLKGWYNEQDSSPKIDVFVGIEGAKIIVEEAFNSNQPCYWVGGGAFFLQALKYSRSLVEQKIKKLKLKVIQPDVAEAKALTKIISKQNLRILPKNFQSRVGYLVYGDNVIIGIIKDEVTTIKITSKDCSQAFVNYFEVMWKLAK